MVFGESSLVLCFLWTIKHYLSNLVNSAPPYLDFNNISKPDREAVILLV